ncbi:S-type pyocin domain-containing protein [Pseudomonas sp. S 311-6]|uniref:S-type pyocin domain-containing protein n=1 Tax=Pseudomonas TaxID=286 RepID=UPI002096FB29|nr:MULTISPECIES: S-type pyocin domain-containing protein [Pseudomonas]MCO7563662.1 S-type pyocin domain-containing protein [Pseudomonas mosselii]MCO7618185.1 S-type pyocin domain-containing protein [Pseudomonas guariconensis]MCO7635318.1 S-type pyocin domain-containing protein [Pseudomonas sp. S 311-6]
MTESIRYLQQFSSALGALRQRALVVEQLQARHQTELKIKAEEERKAKEADQKAEAERKAKEAARRRISYSAFGSNSASLPLVLPIGTASFAIPQSAYTALQLAIRSAVANLAVSAAPAVGHVLVSVLTLAWPSTLGNSERRYLTSIPLTDLTPPGGPDLTALAASAQSLDLPYILAGVEHDDELAMYVVPGGRPVPVRAASFDAERQVYSLALDQPQRILTWTPANAPGSGDGSSTTLPPAPPGTVVYPGSTLNPVQNEQEGYPGPDQLDQERLIVTFPADSGLPPILVVFRSPRFEPGTAVGVGEKVTGIWLGETTRGEGAPIPSHIAELLKGAKFRSFDAFRRRFWKAVANDPELSKQFDDESLLRMKKHGYAPKVPYGDHYINQATFILHHSTPISENGGVYDMDNLKIVTPLAHNTIHYGEKQ